MRCVAYCRVSSIHEDQKLSLENQQNHYKELFKKERMDVAPVGVLYKQDKTMTELNNGIYADEGVSGAKHYKHRQALMRLLEDAKKGLFDRVYCKNVTRYTRSVEFGRKTLNDLKSCGVEVFFEDGAISTFNPTADLIINVLLSTAQEESRLKSSAVQFGIRQQQKKGKYFSAVSPFGYNRNAEGFLEINKREAQIVKLIYELYLKEGHGSQKIARFLNDNNIPTKLGKQWSNKQINDILKNEIYIGKQVTHKVQVDPTNRYEKFKVDKYDRIIHYFEHLKIIEIEKFDIVQLEVERRSLEWQKNNRKVRPSNKHLLSNLLKCGNCQGGMRRKKRKAYARKDGTKKDLGYEWACTINDRYGKSRCEHRNQVVEEEIIEYVKQEIVKLREDEESLDILQNFYMKMHFNVEEALKNKPILEENIKKLDKKIELNFELLGDEVIDKEEYKLRNDDLQFQIRRLRNELTTIANIEKDAEREELKYIQLKKFMKKLNIDEVTNSDLKRLITYITIKTIEDGTKKTDIMWNILRRNSRV